MTLQAPQEKVLTLSSRETAELTGKWHDRVMRDTREMLDDLGEAALSFETSYQDATGRTLLMFALPKDLTITLVAGYSTPLRFKIIRRWQTLEQKRTQPAQT